MNFPRKIIVLQIDSALARMILTLLKQINMTKGVDYIAFESTAGLMDQILDDQPQLIISSPFDGNVEKVANLVRKLREKNPKLSAVLIDTISNTDETGTFNKVIPRLNQGLIESFHAVIAEFQEKGMVC